MKEGLRSDIIATCAAHYPFSYAEIEAAADAYGLDKLLELLEFAVAGGYGDLMAALGYWRTRTGGLKDETMS